MIAGGQLSVRLASGHRMPLIGLGTWKSQDGTAKPAVLAALEVGYRMIDCANDYNNEHEIGAAIKEAIEKGLVKREDLFIQCKLWNSNHRREHVRADLEASLRDLGLDYLDSFIIHWPQACPATGKKACVRTDGAHHGPAEEGCMFPIGADGRYSTDNDSHYIDTWHAMEDLVDAGLVRSIGLSNFNLTQVREVLAAVRKHPVSLLQNECHPYLHNKDLVDFCRINGIVFQAFSPLGSYDRPWAKAGSLTSGRPPTGVELLKDPRLEEVARKHGCTPAQAVLAWHLSRGVSAVPKSVRKERLAENIACGGVRLDGADIAVFDALNIGWRHCLWAETSMHPDYPFRESLPHGYTAGPAPKSTTTSGQ